MRPDIAAQLLAAERMAQPIQAEEALPEPPIRDQAYAIQDRLLALKRETGESLAGYKIANSDPAKMAALGIDEPMFGFLTDAGLVADGGEIAFDRLIGPRIEMEIAFLIGRDLAGESCGVEDVMRATRALAPALEIIDGRFHAAAYNPMRAIADNVSTCRFVLGPAVPLEALPPTFDAQIATDGLDVAAINGVRPDAAPAIAVAALVRKLAREGRGLAAGQVVMSGSLTPSRAVQRGDTVVAVIDGLGRVSCRFT